MIIKQRFLPIKQRLLSIIKQRLPMIVKQRLLSIIKQRLLSIVKQRLLPISASTGRHRTISSESEKTEV